MVKFYNKTSENIGYFLRTRLLQVGKNIFFNVMIKQVDNKYKS